MFLRPGFEVYERVFPPRLARSKFVRCLAADDTGSGEQHMLQAVEAGLKANA
jgi:hypothetical protein